MARGFSDIRFIDGSLDEEIYENVAFKFIANSMSHQVGWYREVGDKVEIMKGDSIDKNWLCLVREIYDKVGKAEDGYIDYRFVRSETVERCTSKTQKGTRCLKECKDGLQYCSVHLKKS